VGVSWARRAAISVYQRGLLEERTKLGKLGRGGDGSLVERGGELGRGRKGKESLIKDGRESD
jgi:hypothetical protein